MTRVNWVWCGKEQLNPLEHVKHKQSLRSLPAGQFVWFITFDVITSSW